MRLDAVCWVVVRQARLVEDMRVMLSSAWVWQARSGTPWSGSLWLVKAGKARRVMMRLVNFWQGRRGEIWAVET